jgi:hypothetical protein
MKHTLWIWIAGIGLALLLLPGCNSMGKTVTGLAKALAKDPATVRLSYGPLIFERFVPSTNIVAAPDLGGAILAAYQLGRLALAPPGTPAAVGGAVPAPQVFFQPQAIPLTSLPLIPTNILFIPVPPPQK